MATNSLPITLMVDKSSKRVIFAESDSHFVQILLSFLTLPLASILRLSKKHPLGSMRKLFESVENLNSECFSNEACKSMLLNPLNSAIQLFSTLKINYDKSIHPPSFAYLCNDRSCSDSGLTLYANARCTCQNNLMNRRVRIASDHSSSSKPDDACMFSQSANKFIITDNLFVSQSSTDFTFELLSKLHIKQGSSLESMRVEVTAEKILELLERLLISDTPLTDIFIGRKNEENVLQIISKQTHGERNCNVTEGPTSSKKTSLKLFLNKEENRVLFAEAEKEFAELLVSFLTYPMGSVVNKLGGKSGMTCIDNLYKSVEALANCFKKNFDKKGILLEPKLPQHFCLQNQLIKFEEKRVMEERYYVCRLCDFDEVRTCFDLICNSCIKSTNKRLTVIDPKLRPNDACGEGGYMMSSRLMVTDDLVVKPLSSVMVVTDLFEWSGKGIVRRNVEIGEHEALVLLQASISSEKVLTDAFLFFKYASD